MSGKRSQHNSVLSCVSHTHPALVSVDQSISLPPPKLENLPALADMMEQLVMENKRSAAAEILRQSEYIGELLSIFSQVEDLEDWGTCVLIFKIINGMGSLLNDLVAGLFPRAYRV